MSGNQLLLNMLTLKSVLVGLIYPVSLYWSKLIYVLPTGLSGSSVVNFYWSDEVSICSFNHSLTIYIIMKQKLHFRIEQDKPKEGKEPKKRHKNQSPTQEPYKNT